MPNPFECFRNITKYKPYVFTNIKVTDNSVVNIYKLIYAFDRVWHTGLLYKLRKIGIDGNLLSWVTDYLDDRKQKVIKLIQLY
jgi:hypothetical protein